MQYGDPIKQTKLTIREDKAVSFASILRGAKLDSVGFNIRFITERNPRLAVELTHLAQEAGELREDSPKASDEDTLLALEQLRAIMGRLRED